MKAFINPRPAVAFVLVASVLVGDLALADSRRHWSFVPPRRPSTPDVKAADWAQHSCDRFVLARLEAEGLPPSPEADAHTLIRRVSLDLTGVPPGLEEVDGYVSDPNPDVYERLVDRLLASPSYGERMALDWLDGARYADTFGYHEDWPRDVWAWRDWVISAFNSDLPFDQFTVEQLAGDLLTNPTQDQIIATGFNRLHGVTASGHPTEFRVKHIVDRVKTTSAVWLGLTLECAQCHTHKYDPVSQKEFYRFYAFFNTINAPPVMGNGQGNLPPKIQLPSVEQKKKLAALEQEIAGAEKALSARAGASGSAIAAWEKQATTKLDKKREPEGLVSRFGETRQFDGQTKIDLADEAPDGAGFERDDSFSFGARVFYPKSGGGPVLGRVDGESADRGYDLVIDPRGKAVVHLTHRWPSSAIQVLTRPRVDPDGWHHLFVTYDGSSKSSGIKIYFDGKLQTFLEITHDNLDDTIRTDQSLVVGRRKAGGKVFTGSIEDVRVYNRQLTQEEVTALADPSAPILAIAADKRTEKQKETLRQYYLENHDDEYEKLTTALADLREAETKLQKSIPTTMVMREMKNPRRTHILIRGEWNRAGEEVTAGTPTVLPPIPTGEAANRLGLARWLVDSSHPLTSRVTVNRFWQLIFGAGIVKTAEDFGTQGELPSHPDLLDFLATEFIRIGWDTKMMMRQLVTSATYRQSSKVTPALLAKDRENRLLARGPRFRLPAELLRDNALAISGLLLRKIGGPSVRPYQPPGLWKEATNRPYKQDHGDKLYRRGLYTYWRRSGPPPNMVAMDATNREVCIVRRQRTNTPLAALVMMNDPTFVEAARALAERVLKSGSSVDERVELLFRLATARFPGRDERAILLHVYNEQIEAFRQDDNAAKELLAVGESERDERLDVFEHAAWTAVATLVLNLDETMTKE